MYFSIFLEKNKIEKQSPIHLDNLEDSKVMECLVIYMQDSILYLKKFYRRSNIRLNIY